MVNYFCLMEKIIANANPKALNIDAIKYSTSKVTLGFKCNPELKVKLAEDAELNGLTLSAYTELMLTETHQYLQGYKKENAKLKSIMVNLKNKLDFYECPELIKLFENNKNQVHTYKNTEGKDINLKVETLQDAYIIIINSFK
jgi:hypothetical protein